MGQAPLLSGVCPAVEALLAHERTIVPCAPLLRARSFARARHALLSGTALALAPSVAQHRSHRLLFGTTAGIAMLTSAAGAYQLGRRAAEPPATVAIVQPRQAGSPPPPPPAATGTLVRSPATPTRAAARGRPLPGAASEPDTVSDDELRLLELARTAALRRTPATVVAIAAEHASRYPASRLAEDREALRLHALIALGRRPEARKAAERFRREFPRSVLLGRLEEMLTSGR
jgi:hypothetical protein